VKPRCSSCVMDCSGSSDGQIKRTKIVLKATALFLFTSFSIRIIFVMGESIRTQVQDGTGARSEVLRPQ
jgi:hypothetical protein